MHLRHEKNRYGRAELHALELTLASRSQEYSGVAAGCLRFTKVR
jgi:hypothetical protein